MSKVNMSKVNAPWTDDQVKSLNEYQACDYMHEFTYSNGMKLIATKAGWVVVTGGPVVQTWAHDFMADWSWKKLPRDLKARAMSEVGALTKEKRESIARTMREVKKAVGAVGEQAEKVAVALEDNNVNLALREMETFHTLVVGVTDALSIVFAAEKQVRR